MELLYLLGLLPGSIQAKELDYLWRKYKAFRGEEELFALESVITKPDEDYREYQWQRAFLKLRKYKLVEEHSTITDRSINLPFFVRIYASAHISLELYDIFRVILRDYLKKELSKLYERN